MSGIGIRCRSVGLTLAGRRVLSGLDLEIAPGSHCLLMGANGAGKTQLLKLLAGERWPTPTRRAVREYFDRRGRPVALPDLLPRVAHVSGERQDKYHRYDWNFSVERVVGTGCHGGDRPTVDLSAIERRRVRQVLRRLGLWSLRRRPILTLSYGQRRLVMLARALAGRPRLLLLDEPHNGLDRAARALLDRELARLARTGLTIVLTAHRADDVPAAFRRTLVLERGRLCYDGPRAGAPARWLAADQAGMAAPRMGRALRRPVASAPLAVLEQVALHRDYRPVISGLDWTIGAGEHWAIVGGNGSGKSTLLGCLYGLFPVALGGRLSRRGHPPGTHLEAWRRRVGFVSPELQTEYTDQVSVLELVASGLRASIGLDLPVTHRERLRALEALRTVGLAVDPERPARDLSYGQRRLALIARALVLRPEALLLDEPLTGLDAPLRARVKELLSRLAAAGIQLVVAAHHQSDLVPEIAQVLAISGGRGTVRPRRPTSRR